MQALDGVFKDFFYMVCSSAKWIFAIKMATSIIKQSDGQDIEGIIKTLISGGFSYGALYSVVSVLDSIKGKF